MQRDLSNMEKINRVVVPVDTSVASKIAAEQGAYFAKLLNVDVSIISVNDTSEYMVSMILEEKMRNEKQTILDEVKRMAEVKGINVNTELMLGRPAEEIVKYTNEDDLIVMASQGKVGFNKFLLGSVSEEVLRRAPCNVMIIKPKAKKKLDDFKIK